MEIHPIRNDDDHAAALREIEKLWGAAVGTEDGDKLDILATLVEKYEEGRWPNLDTSDPIDLLNHAIEELGSRDRDRHRHPCRPDLAREPGQRQPERRLIRARAARDPRLHRDRPAVLLAEQGAGLRHLGWRSAARWRPA